MGARCGPGPQQVVVRGGARRCFEVQRAYGVHGRHGTWACGFLRSSHARLLLRLLMLLVLHLLLPHGPSPRLSGGRAAAALLLVELRRLLMLLLLLRSRLRLLLWRRPLIALELVLQAPWRTSAPSRSGRVLVRTHVQAAPALAAPAPGEFPTGRAPCSCGHDVDEEVETFKK